MKNTNINWSFGWDNINWELYSKIYKEKKDRNATFLNINTKRLGSFFENRFLAKKEF